MPTVINLLPFTANTRFKNTQAQLIRATNLSVIFELQRKLPVAVLKLYLQSFEESGGETIIWNDEASGLIETKLTPDEKSYHREKNALNSITHSCIPRIYHSGTVDATTGSVPYLLLQHFRGKNLADTEQEKLSPAHMRKTFICICHALDATHSQGYLHCDIKPSNIIVNSNRAALIDFGLSIHKDNQELDDIVRGTPSYVSPEQAQARTLDERTDIYSLGATLYYAFTRQTLFGARSAIGYLTAHLHEPVPMEPLENTPKPIKEIILRCLEKDRDARYNNARELAHELENITSRNLSSSDRVYIRISTPSDATSHPSGDTVGFVKPAPLRT